MCHCCLLERILRASLEWREVANLLVAEGLWSEADAAHAGGPAARAWAIVGRHLRRDPAFAQRLVHVVSALHASWRRAVARLPATHLAWLAGTTPRPEPGLVWALVCDERPAVQRLGALTAAHVLAASRT